METIEAISSVQLYSAALKELLSKINCHVFDPPCGIAAESGLYSRIGLDFFFASVSVFGVGEDILAMHGVVMRVMSRQPAEFLFVIQSRERVF